MKGLIEPSRLSEKCPGWACPATRASTCRKCVSLPSSTRPSRDTSSRSIWVSPASKTRSLPERSTARVEGEVTPCARSREPALLPRGRPREPPQAAPHAGECRLPASEVDDSDGAYVVGPDRGIGERNLLTVRRKANVADVTGRVADCFSHRG